MGQKFRVNHFLENVLLGVENSEPDSSAGSQDFLRSLPFEISAESHGIQLCAHVGTDDKFSDLEILFSVHLRGDTEQPPAQRWSSTKLGKYKFPQFPD